ncbi:hypothetical protein [Jatrophihabitans sp.]|uniref:hypothetical protein n=1 Tax=Jatrophihabitans sp. TaxID=1932789 RepID=UPI002B650274|nr:hypothetical protein [Jatrophihabitans sp.]
MTISRWAQGRETIDQLLAQRRLQRVPPNRDHADWLINTARRHLVSAATTVDDDPEGCAALLYDGARKALAAVLANQGLRATSDGGHLAVYESVTAQLDPPLGKILRPFDRLRRQRNQVEYPSLGKPAPELDPLDLSQDIAIAREIVDTCARVLDQMPVY